MSIITSFLPLYKYILIYISSLSSPPLPPAVLKRFLVMILHCFGLTGLIFP